MSRNALVLCIYFAINVSFANAADKAQSPARLTAAQIADRNVAARGGVQAWRSVQTLLMSGKMEAGGNNRPTLAMNVPRTNRNMPQPRPTAQVRLPFVMEEKRPLKTRLEIQFRGQTAVQVFDGTFGWKLRPFLNRRDVEPYTEEEMKTVSLQDQLDGPMVDYAAKGTRIELAGIEKVEDRDNYKLKLTLKSGKSVNLWIDAQTFLETKIEGTPRRLDGVYHPVEIYYLDYRTVGALKIPFLMETRVLNVYASPSAKIPEKVAEQIVLDKVEVNPKLDDTLFTKAGLDAAASGNPTETVAAKSKAR